MGGGSSCLWFGSGVNSVENHAATESKTTMTLKYDTVLVEVKELFREGNEKFRLNDIENSKNSYLSALLKLAQFDKEMEENNELEPVTHLSHLGVIHYAEGRYIKAKLLLSDIEKQRNKIPNHINLRDPCLLGVSIAMKRDCPINKQTRQNLILITQIDMHCSIDSITADLLNNLAACFEVTGELIAAYEYYLQSLRLRKVLFGKRSLKVAEALQNLATVLDARGDAAEAEKQLTAALSIETEIRGQDCIESAVTMSNLGILLAHLGDLPRALDLLTRSHAVRLRAYGFEHEITRHTMELVQKVQSSIDKGEHKININRINSYVEAFIEEGKNDEIMEEKKEILENEGECGLW